MKKAMTLAAVLFVVCSMTLFAGGVSESPQSPNDTEQAPAPDKPRVKLATTTSTDNSGLLGYLLPEFTKDTGYIVDVIAVGTGAALGLGEKGDVDVVFVHARAKEDEFVDAGYGVNRKDVMYNDFVILGPEDDPAGIGKAADAAGAIKLIAEAKVDFVSRGDNSGTHFKELSLWDTAGITPEGAWYKEAGQGMGAVITMTNDLQGYTMADRGTFISMKDSIDLVVCFDGEASLFNPYGIIAVNPELHSHVNYEGAMALVDWIVSDKGQKLIGDFKKGGEQLFYPDAR
ncbi:substrate-binding domain-containing protein [Marispirochaeta sp.]|uniref:substrate-binding domain-containing protein n=1 Tax=Marispirochaeta sp. TaxID=2038653 RepID=UPI0029C69B52|nr:substrate-binding domain-containing protein [Marispirochaeta sp.]